MAVLEIKDLVVSFGGVRALNGLDLVVNKGSVHGIIGPNGAGKTTTVNVLTRFVPAESGSVLFESEPLPKSPHLVACAGMSRTFQAPSTFPELSALENVMCGGYRWSKSGLFRSAIRTRKQQVEERDLRTRAGELLERVGFEFPFGTRAALLPYGAHRKVEIARALMLRPRLLLLDEPTAGLSADELLAFGRLLNEIRNESDGEFSVLLIEHNVPFIFGLCDQVTAMDDGKAIATGTPAQVRAVPGVIESYLSAPEAHLGSTGFATSRVAPVGGSLVKEREGLTIRSLDVVFGRVHVLRQVNLMVRPGELVLLYGRNGAGKSTLLNSVMGHPKPVSGEIEWDGERIEEFTVSKTVRRGIGLVPQERGVISGQTVEENLRLSTMGLHLNRSEYGSRVEELMTRFPELARRRKELAGTLSGGERQMLALAKVLIRTPRLLLLDEPSIGLAPKIVAEMRAIVSDISASGVSLLVAEQNVWWISDLATRAYLLESGRIVAEGLPAEIVTREALTENYLGAEISRL